MNRDASPCRGTVRGVVGRVRRIVDRGSIAWAVVIPVIAVMVMMPMVTVTRPLTITVVMVVPIVPVLVAVAITVVVMPVALLFSVSKRFGRDGQCE